MKWLEPWDPIMDEGWSADRKAAFCRGWEEQLAQEVGPEHLLFQQSVSLIARNYSSDDALFQLPDGRIAEVHLTWRKSMEPDPRWPSAALFTSLDEWECKRLARWHQEWQAENAKGS